MRKSTVHEKRFAVPFWFVPGTMVWARTRSRQTFPIGPTRARRTAKIDAK
jgi:hypothetical protein